MKEGKEMRLISKSSMRVLLIGMLVVSGGQHVIAQKHQDCTPSFPFRQQWLGADDAYSVPLKDGRDVWIFGDTLYGNKRVINGDEPRMVRNTIGISTCQGGKWDIDYAIRKGARGEFRDFFEPQHPKTWYWPMDGVEIKGELWVTLLCVRNSPAGINNGFGFELCGTDLARVTNMKQSPHKWKISYQPLAKEALHANPTSSAIVKDSYLYLYANADEQKAMQLTRIPVDSLDHAEDAIEYLGKDGVWRKGYEPKEALAVMQPGASEMSVRYHPKMKQWVSVLLNPDLFSSGEVWIRFAPKMRGPWSKPKVIYHVPEMDPKSAGYDKDIFCYAGKEHPEFEKSGQLVFTYACNMTKPKKLETRTDIYFPKVVRMPMPSVSAAERK